MADDEQNPTDVTETAPLQTDAAADESEATAAADAVPQAAPTPPREPQEQLSPKERRVRLRAARKPATRGPVSPQERQAERDALRKTKAARRRVRRVQERVKATERRAASPAPEPLAPVHAPTEGRRKVRLGIVVSSKADKTITVRVDVARRHRRYEKIVRSSTTFHAHDEANDANEGDTVRIVESRPLSRTKRWRLVDVLERAQ
jgi:small subunit ribosomal protein S17